VAPPATAPCPGRQHPGHHIENAQFAAYLVYAGAADTPRSTGNCTYRARGVTIQPAARPLASRTPAVACDHRAPTEIGVLRADALAAMLPAHAWQRMSAGTGTSVHYGRPDRRGDRDQPGRDDIRTHSMVRERVTQPSRHYSAVYPSLEAGEFTLQHEGRTAATVNAHGGQVTRIHARNPKSNYTEKSHGYVPIIRSL
jgi:hypothetical protein